MSEDPYEGTTGNIMTQNRYAYAENDPVKILICYNDLVSQNTTNVLEKYYESRFNQRACRQVNADVCNTHDIGEFASTVL